MLKPVTTDIEALNILDERLRWLSAWTIHHSNHVRENAYGLKVGGHQASCASMSAIMAALYFHALGSNDRVAVKPHGGPLLHAIHYLLGSQSREALENFRALGGDFVSVNLNCLDSFDPATVKTIYWDGRHDNWQAGPRDQPWPVFTDA